MTQITLNIPEDKMDVFLHHIQELDFVELEEEYQEPTHEEIKEGLRRAFKEVKMIEEGKMEATSLEDFLEELKRDEL